MEHPQGLSPLSIPAAGLNLNAPGGVSASATGSTSPSAGWLPASVEEIRAVFRSPQQVRQSYILAELLRPPLSLRQGRPLR
jgi:hypothetical protein